MVRDKFTGRLGVPSKCCGAMIIPFWFMELRQPVCSNCHRFINFKDRMRYIGKFMLKLTT